MKSKLTITLLAAAMLGLAACSQNPPPADSLPIPGPAASSAAAPAAATGVGTGTLLSDTVEYFTVDPGQVFACDGRDRATSTVKWKINDPSVTTVKLQVNTAADPERKTFATEGGSGEAKTENWVVAGVRFYLVDAGTGKDLASYEVTSQPCQ